MAIDLKSDLAQIEKYYIDLQRISSPNNQPGYNHFLNSYKEIQDIINDDSETGRKILVRVQDKLGRSIYEYSEALKWALRFWTVIMPLSSCIHHISKHSPFFASCSDTNNTFGELFAQGFELLQEGVEVDNLKEALERRCFEIIEKDDEITDVESFKHIVNDVYSYFVEFAGFVNFNGDIDSIKERITKMIRYDSYTYYNVLYNRCSDRERVIIECIFQDELIFNLVTEVKGKIEMGEANILSDKYKYLFPKLNPYLSRHGIDIEEMIKDCRIYNYPPESLAYYICEKIKQHQIDYRLKDSSRPPTGFFSELMDLMDRFVRKNYCSENNFSKKFNACFEKTGLK